MSLPRYEKYKNSGMEWIGEVPEHWNVQRLKYLVKIKKRISGEEGFDILSITQQGVKIKDIESNDGQLSMDYSKYQFVEIGDFAMNHMDLLTGYVDISKYYGVTSPDYRVFSVRNENKCLPAYLLYLLQNAYKQKILYAFGQGASQLGRWRLPTEQFNDFVIPLPGRDEQKQITAFIDRETIKIDTLISEQQRLIELLKEKRQAVISHAVTKGLNPAVEMKNSGIEWLGEVPEHWHIKKLKHLGIAQIGLTYNPDEVVEEGAGTLVLRSSNVQDGLIVLDDNIFVNKDIPENLATKAGDILICSRNGSRALIGKNAMIDSNAAGLSFGAFMTIFRSDINDYLFWIFNSRLFEFQSGSFLTSTINQLTIGDLYGFEVPLPPRDEQFAIQSFLCSETAKIDGLYAQAQKAITLFQERRAALISAAVTGKIDVRGLATAQTKMEKAA